MSLCPILFNFLVSYCPRFLSVFLSFLFILSTDPSCNCPFLCPSATPSAKYSVSKCQTTIANLLWFPPKILPEPKRKLQVATGLHSQSVLLKNTDQLLKRCTEKSSEAAAEEEREVDPPLAAVSPRLCPVSGSLLPCCNACSIIV